MPSLQDLPTNLLAVLHAQGWGRMARLYLGPGSILLLWGDSMVTSALGPDGWGGPAPPTPAVTLRWPVIRNQLCRPCGRHMTQLDMQSVSQCLEISFTVCFCI